MVTARGAHLHDIVPFGIGARDDGMLVEVVEELYGKDCVDGQHEDDHDECVEDALNSHRSGEGGAFS